MIFFVYIDKTRGIDNFWEVGGGGLASRIEFGAYNESRIHYIWTLLSFDFCMYNTAYNLLLR